jgi:flagellar biosynthesis component FlhA
VEKVLKELAPPPVVVTLPSLRRSLARLLREFDHRVPVLSFTELATDVITVPGGVVGSPDLVSERPAQSDVQQQAQRI